MIFNLGFPKFMKFKKMLRAMKADKIEDVVKEIKNSLYYRQVKNRADKNIEILRQNYE